MHHKINRGFVAFAMSAFIAGCGGSRSTSSGAGIPLIEPPVSKATPTGLVSALLSTARRPDGFRILTLDIDEVKSRFFSDGPSEISELLKSIDTRLSEINTRSTESTHDCLSATAVADAVSVFGVSTSLQLQCYDVFGDSTGGMMFGKSGDTWYLYTNVGQSRGISKVAPVSGSDGDYTVESWMSVGQGNSTSTSCSSSWSGCSYGVMHLTANSATKAFEMTAAGTGMGYCGVHLMSDGTNLYVKGSAGNYNSGSWSCASSDSVCGLASDPASAGDCSNVDQPNFTLTTLGVTGHSDLGTGVTLDGSTTDSVHFGRSVSELSTLSGVAAF